LVDVADGQRPDAEVVRCRRHAWRGFRLARNLDRCRLAQLGGELHKRVQAELLHIPRVRSDTRIWLTPSTFEAAIWVIRFALSCFSSCWSRSASGDP
jgi:hypothetical protein